MPSYMYGATIISGAIYVLLIQLSANFRAKNEHKKPTEYPVHTQHIAKRALSYYYVSWVGAIISCAAVWIAAFMWRTLDDIWTRPHAAIIGGTAALVWIVIALLHARLVLRTNKRIERMLLRDVGPIW